MIPFQDEAEKLKKSTWPKCDQLAEMLAVRGASALQALEYAAGSKIRHVRSACLRAINQIDSKKGRTMAELMLKDQAYDVRETAAKILGVPTPD